MHLLFVVGNVSAFGGTERVTAEISSALADGYDVTVLSLFSKDEPFFDFSKNVSIKSLNIDPNSERISRYIKISNSIHNVVRDVRADVVILVDTILFAFCLPWRFFSRVKIISWEHFNLSTYHGSRFRAVSRLLASKFSDGIVVLTDRDAETWRGQFNIRGELKAICNPIPRFPNITNQDNSHNNKVVLAVGRLAYEKGFDVLLQAWSLVAVEYPDWQLRIVGAGKLENELKNLTNELKLSETVVFTGKTKRVELEYSKASVYVMSSRWEGLPMTLIEAQFFGLPSISTDCKTGPREVLSHNNGILVKVDDVVNLADTLILLLSDSNLREELSLSAKLNSSRYSITEVTNQWESFLKRIV